jgi:molybdopterin/thiamine biosynthesis adenylyltransferase/rhodanese-related sulfurtransferase
MSSDALARYARQIAVPEIGIEGQRRIGAASVLVVGAGGLGCAALPYLCAAGVRRVVLVDHDRVEESNLHRQPLYRMSDVGQPKVVAAKTALQGLNSHVAIDSLFERLTPANAPSLVAQVDLIVDAADSFAVTYTLSDECERAGKPLVSASVLGLSGYVGAFCGKVPSYRAVFPELPLQAGTCAGSGVLGTAVGVIGALQAQLSLSLVLPSIATEAAGQLFTMDFRTMRISSFSFRSARDEGRGFRFISPAEVDGGDIAIELRDSQEAPLPAVASSTRLRVDEVDSLIAQLSPTTRVVFCCRTGLRAWRAAARLRSAGHENVALIAAGD